MDKDLIEQATSQNTYEIKGQLNLLREDVRRYAKQLGTLLSLILVALVYIAFRLS